MRGRWLIIMLGGLVWAHHLSAAVVYELVNQQRVAGDRILNIYPQGVRFQDGFNPGPIIPWTQLSTNSVLKISLRLQGVDKNIFAQKTPEDKNAIVAALRARLTPAQRPGNPGPQPGGGSTPVVPGAPPARLSLPAAPADELPVRPPLTPLTAGTWRGMPGEFVPHSDPNADPPSLLGSLFASPISLFFFLLIQGANFYLAREVADCRLRPRKIVCGLSVLAPFIVPLVFMLLPVPDSRAVPGARSRVAEAAAYAAAEEDENFEPEPEPVAAVSAPPPAAAGGYYHRDQVKFNRNFFTTELMRFNRTVPIGEWLVVRTNEGREYWAGRITNVDMEKITLSVAVGEVWSDQEIRYYQINEIFTQPAEG
jgi:hypothetical protein